MTIGYSVEKNVQILIALLKEHGIKKIVASPGSTNICFVASIQNDPFFEVYSCVDERSAAYMACGIAAECNEPVVLSCTGATASRNYIPALTEAFYRKLPILAVTSTRPLVEIGQNIPQVMDRTSLLNDIAALSVYLPKIDSKYEEWACNMNVNKAILELRRKGGAPVHVNLMTEYSSDFSVKQLPEVRVIKRIEYYDSFPSITYKRIGIFVGSHSVWSERLTREVDAFCEKYNAVVLYDPTSNYKGKYGIMGNLVMNQHDCDPELRKFDLLIHIGDMSGAYMTLNPKNVWRVHIDGEIRDTFKKLTHVFAMRELEFFRHYVKKKDNIEKNTSLYESMLQEHKNLEEKVWASIDELPFSNSWIALNTAKKLPEESVLHLAILNSLRSWSFVDIPKSVNAYSNVGGFGIDGCVSSMLGASFVNQHKLFYCVVGDLAFFYDLNSIGNRHIGNNVRIMLINNGIGVEFKLRQTLSIQAGIGSETDKYIAAAGHFGNKSPELVKHYCQDLGFEYISASSKKEYLKNIEYFMDPSHKAKPILFEVFTDQHDESDAILRMRTMVPNMKKELKKKVEGILGESVYTSLKKIVKK